MRPLQIWTQINSHKSNHTRHRFASYTAQRSKSASTTLDTVPLLENNAQPTVQSATSKLGMTAKVAPIKSATTATRTMTPGRTRWFIQFEAIAWYAPVCLIIYIFICLRLWRQSKNLLHRLHRHRAAFSYCHWANVVNVIHWLVDNRMPNPVRMPLITKSTRKWPTRIKRMNIRLKSGKKRKNYGWKRKKKPKRWVWAMCARWFINIRFALKSEAMCISHLFIVLFFSLHQYRRKRNRQRKRKSVAKRMWNIFRWYVIIIKPIANQKSNLYPLLSQFINFIRSIVFQLSSLTTHRT